MFLQKIIPASLALTALLGGSPLPVQSMDDVEGATNDRTKDYIKLRSKVKKEPKKISEDIPVPKTPHQGGGNFDLNINYDKIYDTHTNIEYSTDVVNKLLFTSISKDPALTFKSFMEASSIEKLLKIFEKADKYYQSNKEPLYTVLDFFFNQVNKKYRKGNMRFGYTLLLMSYSAEDAKAILTDEFVLKGLKSMFDEKCNEEGYVLNGSEKLTFKREKKVYEKTIRTLSNTNFYLKDKKDTLLKATLLYWKHKNNKFATYLLRDSNHTLNHDFLNLDPDNKKITLTNQIGGLNWKIFKRSFENTINFSKLDKNNNIIYTDYDGLIAMIAHTLKGTLTEFFEGLFSCCYSTNNDYQRLSSD